MTAEAPSQTWLAAATLITPPGEPRLIADVTPDGLAALHARWEEWLHIEPLVTRGPA